MPANETISVDDHNDSPAGVRIRKCFQDFVVDDSLFNRFIEFCNRKARQRGRLMSWQADLWKRFTDANSEFAGLDLDAILDAFRVCHVHMVPLKTVAVPIRRGVADIYYSLEFEGLIARDAPYSASDVLDSPSWVHSTHVNVEQCAECIARRKQIEDGVRGSLWR